MRPRAEKIYIASWGSGNKFVVREVSRARLESHRVAPAVIIRTCRRYQQKMDPSDSLGHLPRL